MDIDRETVWQLAATVIVLTAFVAGLVVFSQSFSTDVVVEDESVSGDLSGQLNYENETGSTGTFEGDLNGEFNGSLSKDVEAEITGTIDGEPSGSALDGSLDGNISGPLEGEITGDVTGTYHSENGSFDGEITGTVNGTTEQVSPDGGLALLALLAAFLIAFPVAGYIIQRKDFEE